jgi:hypothetical protein
MRQTYQDGARIHTNSWGGPTGGTSQQPQYGSYVLPSQQVDQAARELPDMLILFAAGNEGIDRNSNGVVDPDSIGQPGTAKNVITVGASESLQPQQQITWGRGWSQQYPANPIRADLVADKPEGIAAFSSRGPTDDGRIKPELVAPGTMIISARSQVGQSTGWGEYDRNYLYMGGTSMATPLAAGGAALVREWLTTTRAIPNPSSALMKAVILNGAADTAPGQYGADATREIPSSRPNNVAGWGRLDLLESLNPAAPRKVWLAENTTGVATGGGVEYQITVGASTPAGASTETGNTTTPAPTPSVTSLKLPPLQHGTMLERTTSAQDVELQQANVIQNGGFENSTFAPWQVFGSLYSSPILDRSTAASGAQSARLAGDNDADHQVWQRVAVPAGTTSASLSFRFQLRSEETFEGYDFFCASIWDEAGENPYLLDCVDQGKVNNDTGPVPWITTPVTYNLSQEVLSQMRGKTVLVAFLAITDSSLPSTAWVDAVNFSISGAAPVTPSPTPPGPTPTPPGPTPTPPGPTPTPPPAAAAGPLRLTLVWTDVPGSPTAARALVNDLDLEIIAPDGTTINYGNQGVYPPNHPCLREGRRDQCNNVESIFLPQTVAGTYRVIVRGAQVPQGGNQPFALVGSGTNLTGDNGKPLQASRTSIFLPLVAR